MTAWIAGRGAISAFGAGVPALVEGVWAGRTGLRAPERLAGVPSTATVLGEVPGARGSALELARAAGAEALRDWTARGETALVLASTKGELGGVEGRGPGLGDPGALLAPLSAALDLGGPRAAVSTACASALSGLALAGRWLRSGRVRHALVVGVDALAPFVVRGFAGLLALDPGPCRPFDRARRGLSLGEGAGALLLTSDAARGGPWALEGWGEANDAHHPTGPRRDGGGLRLAAERALASAGIGAAELDCVALHGTGTPKNDAAEALALKDLCGGPTPPAFGSKAALGHTLGASGVLEALLALAALERAEVPANLRLVEPDVDPALALPRARTPLPRARRALKLAAGFGGIDAAVVIGAAGHETRARLREPHPARVHDPRLGSRLVPRGGEPGRV